MNNPLAQKYNYYLNESHRLSEELQNETEYSELLENILVELIGEEAFYGLFEDLQTSERKRQMSTKIKQATKKADEDSEESFRQAEMGSSEDHERAHDKAAASAFHEISLMRRNQKEKEDQVRLYGKDGKIVAARKLLKPGTEKVVRTPAKYSAFKKPSK
jgi:hypothetical protein